MSRIVVIGDVSGHADQLRHGLAWAGVGDTVGEDVVVIQVGDLVDRGPSGTEVLAMVDRYLKSQPAQWIQLIGNHESQYLGGPHFWREQLPQADQEVLQDWWATRMSRVAAAVRTTTGEEFLITHAGLTVGAWRELGEPLTPIGAAILLNDRPPELLWRGGGPGIDRAAGPLWAEAGWELHEPWMEFHSQGGLVPFGQIHGHSSIFEYDLGTWRAPEKVRLRATVDQEYRHVTVRVGGRQFVGVDPQHGPNGAPRWRPLILNGEVV